MSAPSSDRIEELLAAALEAFDRGGDAAMSAFVEQHPAERAALLRGIARCREIGMLGAADAPRDFPTQLGEFRWLRRLGGGGMGVVFEAEQTSLARRVALKVIRPELLFFEGARERFRREIEAVARLAHPAVVPVLASGEQDGVPYYVMELLPGWSAHEVVAALAGRDPAQLAGSSLRGLLPGGSLGASDPFQGPWWQVCVRLLHGVALGVRQAHLRGIVHRDIKPSNVMLTPHGQAVLLDFGVASIAGSREFTRSGSAPGSPAFMSPEQLRGDAVDERTDVYSLGATLWHLLALAQPFRGVDDLPKIVAGDLPSLGKRNRSVPRELELVVRTAMDRDRERRYPDMAAFAADLHAVLHRRPIRARRLGRGLRCWRWCQRHRVAATLLGTLLLIGVAAPGLLAWRERTLNRDLDAANRTIQARNQELAAAVQAAQDSASRAREKELLAQRKADDVLSLSAIEELRALEERADQLWPADPERLPDFTRWLADARSLIEGVPEDPAAGEKGRPSLAQHERRLDTLRQRARPRTADEVEADRRANPRHAEWQRAESRLTWMQRMAGELPWPSEAQVESELAGETLPSDAGSLNAMAWRLVDADADRVVHGHEVRGLLLARRALAAAGEPERARIRDTLAWALCRCGRFDAALAAARQAAAEAVASDTADLADSYRRLQAFVDRWQPGAGREAQMQAMAALAVRAAELARSLDERATWDFEDREDRWWHSQLAKLVQDLQAFRDEAGGLYSAGTSAKHGWGMIKRAQFASTIRERSVDGTEAAQRWATAIAAIAASPRYDGLRLEPQLGLLPLGADPESGLWEFAHLATGAPAVRGADGRLVRDEAMGLVFVLIPRGRVMLGAQAKDRARAHYDPQASLDESPVHAVELSPCFLAKYEMTQGQWQRFAGGNPSSYGPGRYGSLWNRAQRGWSALHPVEQVTWSQCAQVVARLGLSLPSEAQWERAARGGTDTPWWTGVSPGSLRDAANVLDAYAASHGGEAWPGSEQALDDGNTVHAEVGSYRANPLGLHDVIGNVWEWCLDGYDGFAYDRSLGTDPVVAWQGTEFRVNRGGAFASDAAHARAAFRNRHTPEYQDGGLGLRPARALVAAPPPRPAAK